MEKILLFCLIALESHQEYELHLSLTSRVLTPRHSEVPCQAPCHCGFWESWVPTRVGFLLSSARKPFAHVWNGYALYLHQRGWGTHAPRQRLPPRFQFVCSSSNYFPLVCGWNMPPSFSCNTMGNSWIVLGLAPSTLSLMSVTVTLKHSHWWSQSYLTLQEWEGGGYKLAARKHTLFSSLYFKLSSISCHHFKNQKISNKNLDFHSLLKKLYELPPQGSLLPNTWSWVTAPLDKLSMIQHNPAQHAPIIYIMHGCPGHLSLWTPI